MPDVLDGGSEREPRLTPAARRRIWLGSVVITVALAAVAGGLEVQERRDAAAEERRLAGLLQLSSSEGPWPSFVALDVPSANFFDVNIWIPVRNDGPRDVTVTQASAGEFVLLRPVALPAQATRRLLMQQKVRCAPDTASPPQTRPDEMAAPGPLHVTAETSRGTRTITIERPPYDTELAARWCEALRTDPPGSDPPR